MLTLLLAGCGLPSLGHVRHRFEKENPSYTVLAVTNELDIRHAYYHITYQKPGDQTTHEDVWHYWHAAEAWAGPKMETLK
jgi:hypothetical protein